MFSFNRRPIYSRHDKITTVLVSLGYGSQNKAGVCYGFAHTVGRAWVQGDECSVIKALDEINKLTVGRALQLQPLSESATRSEEKTQAQNTLRDIRPFLDNVCLSQDPKHYWGTFIMGASPRNRDILQAQMPFVDDTSKQLSEGEIEIVSFSEAYTPETLEAKLLQIESIAQNANTRLSIAISTIPTAHSMLCLYDPIAKQWYDEEIDLVSYASTNADPTLLSRPRDAKSLAQSLFETHLLVDKRESWRKISQLLFKHNVSGVKSFEIEILKPTKCAADFTPLITEQSIEVTTLSQEDQHILLKSIIIRNSVLNFNQLIKKGIAISHENLLCAILYGRKEMVEQLLNHPNCQLDYIQLGNGYYTFDEFINLATPEIGTFVRTHEKYKNKKMPHQAWWVLGHLPLTLFYLPKVLFQIIPEENKKTKWLAGTVGVVFAPVYYLAFLALSGILMPISLIACNLAPYACNPTMAPDIAKKITLTQSITFLWALSIPLFAHLSVHLLAENKALVGFIFSRPPSVETFLIGYTVFIVAGLLAGLSGYLTKRAFQHMRKLTPSIETSAPINGPLAVNNGLNPSLKPGLFFRGPNANQQPACQAKIKNGLI